MIQSIVLITVIAVIFGYVLQINMKCQNRIYVIAAKAGMASKWDNGGADLCTA